MKKIIASPKPISLSWYQRAWNSIPTPVLVAGVGIAAYWIANSFRQPQDNDGAQMKAYSDVTIQFAGDCASGITKLIYEDFHNLQLKFLNCEFPQRDLINFVSQRTEELNKEMNNRFNHLLEYIYRVSPGSVPDFRHQLTSCQLRISEAFGFYLKHFAATIPDYPWGSR